jgi:hypothetical protein
MAKNEIKKCSEKVDPRMCQYGHVAGMIIYCPYKNYQAVWERHPERHSDYPIKPSPGECEYPKLYGKGLLKKRKPDGNKLPSLPGPSFVLNWPDAYKTEEAVPTTH